MQCWVAPSSAADRYQPIHGSTSSSSSSSRVIVSRYLHRSSLLTLSRCLCQYLPPSLSITLPHPLSLSITLYHPPLSPSLTLYLPLSRCLCLCHIAHSAAVTPSCMLCTSLIVSWSVFSPAVDKKQFHVTVYYSRPLYSHICHLVCLSFRLYEMYNENTEKA